MNNESPRIIANNRAQNVIERFKALANLVTQLRAGTSPYKGFDVDAYMMRHGATFSEVIKAGAETFIQNWKNTAPADRNNSTLHGLFEQLLNSVVGSRLFAFVEHTQLPALKRRAASLSPQPAQQQTFSGCPLPLPESLLRSLAAEASPQAEETELQTALDAVENLVVLFSQREEFVAHELLTHAVGVAMAAVEAAEAHQEQLVQRRNEERRQLAQKREQQQQAARDARAARELEARRAADEAVAAEMLAMIGG